MSFSQNFLNLDAQGIDDLRWDDEIKAYRFNRHARLKSNKKVSNRELFLIIRRENKATAKGASELADQLLADNISLGDWQRQMARIIKDQHLRLLRFGKGGAERTFANDYLNTANLLRTEHYSSLRKLAGELIQGNLTERQFKNRVTQQVMWTKSSYETAKLAVMQENGVFVARRRLGSCAPHCPECISYAMRGWQPIRDIIPPGVACRCGGNCCCDVQPQLGPNFTVKRLSPRNIRRIIEANTSPDELQAIMSQNNS